MNFSAEERFLVGRNMVDRPEQLDGWYPVLVKGDDLYWRKLGSRKLLEPFFFDSLKGIELNCCKTSFSALDEFEEALAPAAFVFHMSRCGSTLLCQLFSRLDSFSVLSEPPAVDFFLREHHARPGAETTLRKLIAALGQKRFAAEQRFLLKLDSWHIEHLPLFRKAYPEVPFIFIYRQPGEVMASHRRQRGRQMVPGLVDMPGFDPGELAPGDLDGYAERVLRHFLNEALKHRGELVLMNYSQLPGVVWNQLLDILGIDAASDVVEAMQSRAGSHSKNGEKFSVDPEAPACITCNPYYEQLEGLRLEQSLFTA